MCILFLIPIICMFQLIVIGWATTTNKRIITISRLLKSPIVKENLEFCKALLLFLDKTNIATIRYNVDIPITFETISKPEMWVLYPSDQTFIGYIKTINLGFYRNIIEPKLNKALNWFRT